MGCKGLRGNCHNLEARTLSRCGGGFSLLPHFFFSFLPPRPSALDFCKVICVWVERGTGTTEDGVSFTPTPTLPPGWDASLLQTEETSKNGQ